jgi:hypothetical protein
MRASPFTGETITEAWECL